MLKFDHSKSDMWLALGMDKPMVTKFIEKMTDFTNLYFDNERFRMSFQKTPNSYQIEFILNEVLEVDQEDSSQMFLAGHLLGAFHYMKKDMERDNIKEKLQDLVKDAVDKLKKDSSDF